MQVILPTNKTIPHTLRNLNLQGNPIKTLESLCEPVYGHPGLTVHLDRTHLVCDACMVWLVTCPEKFYHDNPPCASPAGLQGRCITAVGHILADIPCPGTSGEFNMTTYGRGEWTSHSKCPGSYNEQIAIKNKQHLEKLKCLIC